MNQTPPPILAEAARLLAWKGHRAYLVGGAVRDLLLGRTPTDYDLAVEDLAERSAHDLANGLRATLVLLDEERRIFRLVRAGSPGIDISALAGTLEEDARKRDFTINALAVPLERASQGLPLQASEVIDSLGGLADLRARVIRTASPDAFADDPLRLLRAFRFAIQLGFVLGPETAAALRGQAARLERVAAERQRDEFCRILGATDAARNLRWLDDFGYLTTLVPELEQSRGVTQPKEHYWNVLEHAIEACAAVELVLHQAPGRPHTEQLPWDSGLADYFAAPLVEGRTRGLILKLAALLHDVAKPATKAVEADGRIHFYGHPTLGAEMSEGILQRLRFSKRETERVEIMVREHLRPVLISRGPNAPTPRALYRFYRDGGEAVVDTLFLCFADYLAAKGPLLEEGDWNQYVATISGMLHHWRAQKAQKPAPKLLDGHQLMAELGLPPGPLVGAILESVREAHAAGEVATLAEALALARRLADHAAAPDVRQRYT